MTVLFIFVRLFHYIVSGLGVLCKFLSIFPVFYAHHTKCVTLIRIFQMRHRCCLLFFMHTYTSIDQFHTQSNYIWHSFLAAKKKTPSVGRLNNCWRNRWRSTQFLDSGDDGGSKRAVWKFEKRKILNICKGYINVNLQ